MTSMTPCVRFDTALCAFKKIVLRSVKVTSTCPASLFQRLYLVPNCRYTAVHLPQLGVQEIHYVSCFFHDAVIDVLLHEHRDFS